MYVCMYVCMATYKYNYKIIIGKYTYDTNFNYVNNLLCTSYMLY